MRLSTTINRLLQLADLLDRVPSRKFFMGAWANRLPPDMDPAREDECGTTACALGWATTLPFARKLGARIEPIGSNMGGVVRTRRSQSSRDVACELFGERVSKHILYLFHDGPRTPREKAAQIRRLCKRLQREAA